MAENGENVCPEDKCASLEFKLEEANYNLTKAEGAAEWTSDEAVRARSAAEYFCDIGAGTVGGIIRELGQCWDSLKGAESRNQDNGRAQAALEKAQEAARVAEAALTACKHACSVEEIRIIDE